MKKEQTSRPLTSITSLALAVTLGAIVSFPASAYELVDLGQFIQPQDINSTVTIVGAKNTDQYPSIAFRWTPTSGFKSLNGTIANAVNDSEEISGNTLTGAFYYNGNSLKYIGDDYTAQGINSLGQIAGSKSKNNPYRATPRPVDPAIYNPRANGQKWTILDVANVYSRGTRDGVYADLYFLADINDAGYAVGKKSRSGLAGSAAFMTTATFDSVSFLPTANGGYASAINNLNNIVGATGSNTRTDEYSYAFLYDGTTVTNLGTLPINETEFGLTSSAYDINDLNQVVGSSRLILAATSLNDPSKYHAFIWENGQMTDLNNLIPQNTNWILTRATAINEYGDIVGIGLKDGIEHGFLLSSTQLPPPPPSENLPPVAIIDTDVTSGKVEFTVNFIGSTSYDPEGSTLLYRWDFGDGSDNSSNADQSHSYTSPGSYTAKLIVTDDQEQIDSSQVTITVRKNKRKK